MSDSEFFSKTDFPFTDTFTDIRKIYSSDSGPTEVYSARKALKRFALKALKPELRDDPFYLGLLRKEFEIGFRLEHPFIVHTYSFEEVEGLGPCIVLEWIEGETLSTCLTTRTLDEKAWHKVLLEICDALEYLETRQIVHRDIKPSNIMLTHDGKQVKLLDFGFADSPEYGAIKHSGGTRAYAAPEQISNSDIKSTSDIYALGKVTEELPIRKNKKVRRLVHRMVSEHPYDRPQSAGEIKEEFGKALSSRPVNIYFYILAIVAVAVAALFFIFQGKETDVISPVEQEMIEPSEDAPLSETPEAATVPTAVNSETQRDDAEPQPIDVEPQAKKNVNSPEPVVEPVVTVSEGKESSSLKTPKRIVHWMVLLTAQETRRISRKLREGGDELWEEHARQEVGEWVDSQTDSYPELRKECLEEIDRVLDIVKNEE